MKFTFRMLMLLMMSVIANSIGAILDQYFDNQSLRLNCVSVTAAISGYLVRGWWPPEEKEDAV
ncbi:hypothetical protein CV739_08980 [Bacillus velezensis]|nr:hypothetical protein CV739_08980 [Bacillus velezensis]